LAVVEHGTTRDPEALLEAARSFFRDCRLDVLGDSPGYSGSVFGRVETSTGTWLLRRWPSGLEEGRLRFVHRALMESRSSGFRWAPRLAMAADGDTIVRVGGHLYDAQGWTAGRPLSAVPKGHGSAPNVAVQVSSERLLALSEAVARFHASTSRLHPEGAQEVDSLSRRLDEFDRELAGRLRGLRAGVRDRTDEVQRRIASGWLDLLPEALGTAREASLGLPSGEAASRVLCHGDLWPAHAHFRGEDFAGFTDFEAMVFAPPILDLAQLVAHFGGWEIRAAVVRTYERFALLGAVPRAALPLEVIADLASEGLWSLDALYAKPSTGPTRVQTKAHEHNLRVLLGCLKKALEEAEALIGEA
jgi:Ser/Thr protein kinase RdoA (MazF antagonist)